MREFKIENLLTVDDTASMAEMISRIWKLNLVVNNLQMILDE